MHEISRKGKTIETENPSVFAWGPMWEQRLVANGTGDLWRTDMG